MKAQAYNITLYSDTETPAARFGPAWLRAAVADSRVLCYYCSNSVSAFGSCCRCIGGSKSHYRVPGQRNMGAQHCEFGGLRTGHSSCER
jgi:hypothetical protein